jgi:hypothetical protein
MGMMLVYLVLFIAPLIIGVCLGIIWEWREAKGIREAALREAAENCKTCQCRDEILELIGEKK